jgi:uncharacterized membrane protein YhhN
MEKLMQIPNFKFLFFGLMIIFTLREYFEFQGVLALKYILTPIITLIIISMVILSLKENGFNNTTVLILFGLLFSLIADVLLMIKGVDLLKYGILFFLVAHVFYIVSFSKGYTFNMWNLVLVVIFAVVIFFFFSFVKEKAGSLQIPVLIYMIILSTMGFFAIAKLNNGTSTEAIMILVGATLFIISDSTLAVNAFAKDIPHASVFTWLTYMPAQLLIALSTFYK